MKRHHAESVYAKWARPLKAIAHSSFYLIYLTAVAVVGANSVIRTAAASPRLPEVAATSATVKHRSNGERVWERTYFETNRLGGATKVNVLTNRYIEIGSGICYQDEAGAWVDAVPEIILMPDGTAQATRLRYKARFGPDLAAPDAVQLTLPNGQRMHSTVRGLVLYDPVKRISAEVALAGPAQAYLIGTNKVVYSNAFSESGLSGSVVYTVSAGGIEQDIVLEEAPNLDLLAAAAGMSGTASNNVLLEVWTELAEAPEPEIESRPMAVGPNSFALTNEILRFDSMKMAQGRAYLREPATEESGTRTAPRRLSRVVADWAIIEGRKFLIEGSRIEDIKEHLKRLPKATNQQAGIFDQKAKPLVGQRHSFPSIGAPSTKYAAVKKAKPALLTGPALVLDYIFQEIHLRTRFDAHETFFVSQPTYIPHDVVFEGSAILKFAQWACLTIAGEVTCKGGGSAPIIFTGLDDDTFGEVIDTSTGNPISMSYAWPFLELYWDGNITLANCRFSYGMAGVYFWNIGRQNTLQNCQFIRCFESTHSDRNSLTAQNCLFWGVEYAFRGESKIRAEHVTVHQAYAFADQWGIDPEFTAVNSIIVAAGQVPYSYTEKNTYFTTADEPIFATSSLGSHYLPHDSRFRHAGLASDIGIQLRKDLRTKTTQVPAVLPSEITESLTLKPTVERNVGAMLDLGFSYEAIDYITGGTQISNNDEPITVTLRDGVCIALDDTASGTLVLGVNGSLDSRGTHNSMNRIVRSRVFQEGLVTSTWVTSLSVSSPQTHLEFTEFPGIGPLHTQIYCAGMQNRVSMRDCQIGGGRLSVYLLQSESLKRLALTNNLFNYVSVFVCNYANPVNEVFIYNNTFRHNPDGTFSLNYGSFAWRVERNLFDTIDYSDGGTPVGLVDNGFHVTDVPAGSGSGFNASPLEFVGGPLGRYYVNGGPVIRVDTRIPSAKQVNLAHYTVIPGGSDIELVDVGFHYVATDASGVPTDTDGDGISDYLEDLNIDEVTDGDPTSWQNYDSPNALSASRRMEVFTPIR